MNVYGYHVSTVPISKNMVTKNDSRNIQERMLLGKNINVVINYADLLLVACKRHTAEPT